MASTPARRYLAGRVRFGIKMGLAPMRALLAELGHPQAAYPCLLVAGTNGKGSVTAYGDAALRAAGLKVGRYTSPHLVRVNERIVVDGDEIRDRDLDRLVVSVRAAAERLIAARVLEAHPTYFEVLTAAAFAHFARQRVDVALIEVGLGGRLDATNTCEPLASAIVTIGHDHEQYLGPTLRDIAREKAGILRPGRTTVLGRLPAAARRAIAAEARRVGARLRARAGTAANASLPGQHQRHNLQVALALLEEARRAGLRFSMARARKGLALARWPGRLQWVAGRPPLLLDGAHNVEGARALAAYVRPRRPFVLVFGVMADKDVEGLARPLFPLARTVIATRAPGERAASPEEILARTRSKQGLAEPSIPRALQRAARLAGEDAFVLVAGSLYLVGDVLARLQRRSRPRK